MELKLKCIVSHGICWNGGAREYSANIKVNLSQEEISEAINVLTNSENPTPATDIEKTNSAIYSKIEKEAQDFKYYTFVLDTCVKWCSDFGSVKEDDLIEEDIKTGNFIPIYENAEGSTRDELIKSQWFCWMINNINNLSYIERAKYLIKKYQMELPLYEEIEFETYYKLCEQTK